MNERQAVEPVHVQVTVDDHTEGFWADPLPGDPSAGVVINALINGAVSYGDVVEWNDDGDVVRIRSRSNRATLICWVELDPEDLVAQAKWTQARRSAQRSWTNQGVVVEGGIGDSLIAAFPVDPRLTPGIQAQSLLRDLGDSAWELHCALSPCPDMTTDEQLLGLTVRPPIEEDEFPDVSKLEPVSHLVHAAIAERDLINRMKQLGHVHAELSNDDVLATALGLADNEPLSYKDALRGRADIVVFRAGWVLCMQRGLLMPEVDGDELERGLLLE